MGVEGGADLVEIGVCEGFEVYVVELGAEVDFGGGGDCEGRFLDEYFLLKIFSS